MLLIVWFLIGVTLLCIGSAIGCFTYRFPLKLKERWTKEAKDHLNISDDSSVNPLITSKRSQCPHCNTTLSIRDLIPLVSYVINKAKCRSCGQPISIRYPIIEIVYLLLLLPLFYCLHDPVEILLLLLFWSSLYTAAVIDFENMFIPDELILLALFSVFSLHIYAGNRLESYVLGAMIGYAVIYLVRLVYIKLKGIEGIGLGDASLMAAIGAIVGSQSIYYVLIIGCAFGVVGHFVSKNKQVPFAPSLVAATAVVYYFAFL